MIWEDPPGEYHDTLLTEVWNRQESYDLVAYTNSLAAKPARQDVDIHLTDKIHRIINVEEAIRAYSHELTYGIRVIYDGDAPTERDYLNLSKLIEYARTKNAKNYSVRYVINSHTDNPRYFCQYYGGDTNKDIVTDIHKCFMKVGGKE